MDRQNSEQESLIRDWLQYIQDVNRMRQRVIRNDKELCLSFMGSPMAVVQTAFIICDHFDLTPNARYVALYLYEKFMWENYLEASDNYRKNVSGAGSWEQVCQKISQQSKLRLMSCIQIASKMESNTKGLYISQVIEALRRLDKKSAYPPLVVYLSEFKVFKTVGFKIPFATPLDCVETLIAATGLDVTMQFNHTAISMLDLSYLQHHQLCARLQLASKSEKKRKHTMPVEVTVLHLGASIVLCTTLLFDLNDTTVAATAAKLADLVHVDQNDIWTMAKILFKMGFETTKTKVV